MSTRDARRSAAWLVLASVVGALCLPRAALAVELYLSKRDFVKPQGATWSVTATLDRYGEAAPFTFTSTAPASSGITMSVSPHPVTGSRATVTLRVAADAPLQTSYFEIVASGGGETKIAPMEVRVTKAKPGSGGPPGTGSFTISAPAAVTVEQGREATAAVSISRTSFSGAVALSLSGAPLGVTASFTPASTTGSSSSMALRVSSGVAPGAYGLTVRAVSGSLVSTAPIALSVTRAAADFEISAPSRVSVRKGQTISLTVDVSRNGLTSPIDFATTAPARVSCSCPSTAGSSSVCSVAAASDAPSGSGSIEIRGSSAGITRSATVAVDVLDPAPPPSAGLKAFPEAQGFAARITGGRGGAVCKVTNLNRSGAGSLQACLDLPGPAIILPVVSGVIRDGVVECHRGNKTIAGQTAPLVVRGLVFDNTFESNPDCKNVIVRHLRSRPGEGELSASGWIQGDAFVVDGVSQILLANVSTGHVSDESLQISRSHDVTVQDSMFGESPGTDHFWHGVLVNYSNAGVGEEKTGNLDRLAFVRNLWNGVTARFPELSCEESGDGVAHFGASNCTGKRLKVEVSNNLVWDPRDPVYYNRCTSTNAGNDCSPSSPSFFLDLNWVGNYMTARSGIDNGMIVPQVLGEARNDVYYADDYYDRGTPALYTSSSPGADGRHDYPDIDYMPAAQLHDYMVGGAGAFPRDAMDRRLIGYLQEDVDLNPALTSRPRDTFVSEAPPCGSPVAAARDTDGDGMPDSWERSHGLIVGVDDHNGTTLSEDGYTNIEVFLNQLASEVVELGVSAYCGY